ncbi:hypothetical protein PENSTE_c016G01432 [Penicillium steckii]|uniref:Uncharacterized protein n=1 Tax=Penicillium steckii TaxID=303698 RepID=A0A1V6T078_9EURO|nr:hypothetical protein PENSTE_c016G01432 [Penicillium steckii]
MKTEIEHSHSSKESWIKGLFSVKSKERSNADDSESEITLVQSSRLDQNSDSKRKKRQEIPTNFNAADMCFGSCCRK